MANTAASELIFIKRVKKRPHGGGHHGGQWKVAYADFVTAMMAFFLLLWLLNATTEEQKTAIADYFAPASISKTKSGAGGVLGGWAMSEEGARISNTSTPQIIVSIPVPKRTEKDTKQDVVTEKPSQAASDREKDPAETQQAGRAQQETEFEEQHSPADLAGSSADQTKVAEQLLAQMEDQEFAKAEKALHDALQQAPDLKQYLDNILIDRTPEGLRIQIVDKDGREMFPLGSAQMYDHTRKLLEEVSKVVLQLPNKISIAGHTDATPYRADNGYGNWELSTDRANATRRAMIAAGLPEARILTVVGKADTDPLLPEDLYAASNRRMSITLLRDSAAAQAATDGAASPAAGPAQPAQPDANGAQPAPPAQPEASAPAPLPTPESSPEPEALPAPADMLEGALPYGG